MPNNANDATSPELRQSIARRLRPVCPDISEDEFERLVRDVARVKAKYDEDPFGDLVTLAAQLGHDSVRDRRISRDDL